MTGKVMKTKSKISGHIIRSGEDTRTYEINHAWLTKNKSMGTGEV